MNALCPLVSVQSERVTQSWTSPPARSLTTKADRRAVTPTTLLWPKTRPTARSGVSIRWLPGRHALHHPRTVNRVDLTSNIRLCDVGVEVSRLRLTYSGEPPVKGEASGEATARLLQQGGRG